ncbi:PucR family transcriptional regulator [Mycobacterium spongiae]|uniref:PucR family transcriptional regulator n=1 Tax=Mycobacterium spongiae TaxID=886343 RepID=A0A975PWW0_9MYCO|nr:PucR family transcriptional regulator [Mycobacterium spongiae]QUR67169.1 PucR family transcriptional regulator [Mycobacterium spongiae]
MVSREPSPRVRELIREAARIALEPSHEWLEEYDQATLAATPPIPERAELAKVISRANRANLHHFALSHLRNPGEPVAPNLGIQPLRMARELMRLGLERLTIDIYRIGQNVAWQRWTEIAFSLTTDPDELHGLLDVPFRSVSTFIDATLAGITAQMELEHDELTRNIAAERRQIADLILDRAPLDREHAQARLDYPLDRSHVAAILWSDQHDADHRYLDDAAAAFGHALGCPRPLTVIAGVDTRWVWVNDAAALDSDQIHEALADTPHVRVAIGAPAPGIEGFRRSHLDAHATRQMLIRLRSPHRVASFPDVEMVALLTENFDGANDFIKNTLGDFEAASPELHLAMRTFIKRNCNVSRAAHQLHMHRNSLVHRLETAQRLLPRSLDDNALEVAVALNALQWRGASNNDPPPPFAE